MIGVDWGTSNLRAFRFDGDGTVIDTRRSAQGIAGLGRDAIEGVLGEALGDWLSDDRDVILTGMVGSRAGWVETDYIPCPVDPAMLAAHLVAVDTPIARCRIVPGVSWSPTHGPGSVMRGEETQLLGAKARDGLVLLPGTHSKWATLEAGRITSVRTAMTGELYSVLLDHSLLGQLAIEGEGGGAFERGVQMSLADPALIMTLFSARADVLLGRLEPTQVRDYLSGLVIGAEIAAMGGDDRAVTLVGGAGLIERYRTALELAGVDQVTLVDGEVAVTRGLWMIGTSAQ